ncbi:iron(III) transport system permease protein [Modestobacter sp. DSM 44400]|uniref:ABC transporter permease n=1 Tax=Modestobacter sp. DSM 44400 TaxID=1550230 RepID=UPI00089A629A|nr:ABC transporter permease subunit [Modestobacter sp. DSM 44400]SDX91329.1 iron(III) transport system permease protein [Modestobacter sp. DSM 44400]
MRGGGSALPRAGATAAVVVPLAALVAFPLFRLVQVAWQEGGGDLSGVLGADGLGTALRNTVVLAAGVTLAAVPLGVVLALVLRRSDLPGRAFWQATVLAPVVVPDFVLGYSWTQAYARAGFTDTLLGLSWAGVQGPLGVWLVLVVNASPLAYLVVAVGLAARAEPDLERAARVSGAGSATTLVTITLRLVFPAVAAAAVLVFVLTLGTFAIPQVLGAPAGFSTVTTRIYADLSIGGDPASFVEAVTLALLLVLVAAATVAPADSILGPRLRAARPADAQAAHPVPGRQTVRRAEAVVLGGYLAFSMCLPLAALALSSVTRALGVPPTPANWTLDSFRGVLTVRTLEALGRSLGLSVVAATLLVVLGGLVAVAERRRAGRATASLITLTLVLPGSTLAVALLIAYGRWLSGSLALILLAYLAKLWAFAHRPIAGALDRLPPAELYAARASGAGVLTAVRTVALRPLAPALLGAWLVCFLTALHEVTMSSLLYGPGSETLAVIVLNSSELGRIGPTAALSVVLTLLVAVPGILLWWASNRLRTRAG